jgi:hypothetical protein
MPDPFDVLLASDEPAQPGETALLPASIERYVLGERERARLRELREKGLGAENTRGRTARIGA